MKSLTLCLQPAAENDAMLDLPYNSKIGEYKERAKRKLAGNDPARSF